MNVGEKARKSTTAGCPRSGFSDLEFWPPHSEFCSLESGGFQELPDRDNGNPLEVADPQQMPVSADDVVGFAGEGALQNAIVVRVVGDIEFEATG